LAAAALYSPAAKGGWAWDDRQLVEPSPALRDLAGLGSAISTDLYRQASPNLEATGYWRPLALASYWLDSRIGEPPRSLHVGNVVLYALAVALLFRVLLRREGDAAGPWAALLAAAWWAFHPEQAEAVAWISCRYDLLAALAVLGLLAIPWRPGPARAGLHGLVFLAGLLSKDGFATMVLVVLADDWVERRGPAAAAWRWGAVAAAIAIWASMRAALGLPRLDLPPVASLPRQLLEAAGTYSLRAVAPLPLTTGHPHEPTTAVTLLGAAVLAALALAVARWRRLTVPAAVLVAGLVPAAVALQNFGEAPERYFYVPSLGLALLAGAGLGACARSERALVRRVGLGAGAALALLGVPPVAARIPDWRSDATLFASALRVNGDDPVANLAYGISAARTGALDEARRALETAQRGDPRSGRIAVMYAAVLLQRGELAASLAQAHRATALAPTQPEGWYYLSVARHRGGDHRGELAALDRALALSPGFTEASSARSVALCELSGRLDCASGLSPATSLP
jgi:tetratricopeptide (TPR) repeat protein